MILKFLKYQGTGNDFIIPDPSIKSSIFSSTLIQHLCDRRFGIGADGLMFLKKHKSLDFEMQYFNADGNEGTMCGNGGRCISAFYYQKVSKKKNLSFQAIDGEHQAIIHSSKKNVSDVSLHLTDVKKIIIENDYFLINTGSPHFVKVVDSIDNIDVVKEGRAIRYNKAISKSGVNVNFVSLNSVYNINVRTYERGVEDETLSCGTGVTASAIAVSTINDQNSIVINTKGGVLNVSFTKHNSDFRNIWLRGPATLVFEGEITI
jgi:diaminopimelate epimerase